MAPGFLRSRHRKFDLRSCGPPQDGRNTRFESQVVWQFEICDMFFFFTSCFFFKHCFSHFDLNWCLFQEPTTWSFYFCSFPFEGALFVVRCWNPPTFFSFFFAPLGSSWGDPCSHQHLHDPCFFHGFVEGDLLFSTMSEPSELGIIAFFFQVTGQQIQEFPFLSIVVVLQSK